MAAKDHLKIAVTHEDERVVLTLDGELDLASAPMLQRAVENVELADKPELVLDLHQLDFIDSTGLRIILAAGKRCEERGQQLTVTRGTDQVERLLSVTGMGERLRTADAGGA